MKKENLFRIFSHMPELETERLRLRAAKVSDAEDMYAYARDPEVTKYLLWRPHPDKDYTRAYLEYLAGRYRIGAHYEWVMISKETGRMIGTCGFAHIDPPNNSAELGYVLNPAYRGQGLVVEAARRVMEFGFSTLSLHRIEARYMAENLPSRRVMEKLGMRFEGIRREAMLVKGLYRDIGVCAILRNEFYRE
jgi:ribosomal-protein-alanine N-acetyltransferase